MNRDQIISAARLLISSGIKLTTANILAIPGGSLDADLETLRVNIQCRPNYASAALMEAFPRAEIYKYAKEKELLDEEHIAVVRSSLNCGLKTAIRFKDNREKRGMENLHKLFATAVRFPWSQFLVHKPIRLPPNLLFDFIYRMSVSYGIHIETLPPKIGLSILLRKIKILRRLGALSNRSRHKNG